MKLPLMDYTPENDSQWDMVMAMERYFRKRYPQNREMIEEMCTTLIAALCLIPPYMPGGAGLLESWEKRIDEIVKNIPGTSTWKTSNRDPGKQA